MLFHVRVPGQAGASFCECDEYPLQHFFSVVAISEHTEGVGQQSLRVTPVERLESVEVAGLILNQQVLIRRALGHFHFIE